MRWIRLYQFRPSSQPPLKTKQLYHWFKEEIKKSSIEPVDKYKISNEGPVGGSEENLSLATRIFEGLQLIKQTYLYLKQHL